MAAAVLISIEASWWLTYLMPKRCEGCTRPLGLLTQGENFTSAITLTWWDNISLPAFLSPFWDCPKSQFLIVCSWYKSVMQPTAEILMPSLLTVLPPWLASLTSPSFSTPALLLWFNMITTKSVLSGAKYTCLEVEGFVSPTWWSRLLLQQHGFDGGS